jgi:hypothetical protein
VKGKETRVLFTIGSVPQATMFKSLASLLPREYRLLAINVAWPFNEEPRVELELQKLGFYSHRTGDYSRKKVESTTRVAFYHSRFLRKRLNQYIGFTHMKQRGTKIRGYDDIWKVSTDPTITCCNEHGSG